VACHRARSVLAAVQPPSVYNIRDAWSQDPLWPRVVVYLSLFFWTSSVARLQTTVFHHKNRQWTSLAGVLCRRNGVASCHHPPPNDEVSAQFFQVVSHACTQCIDAGMRPNATGVARSAACLSVCWSYWCAVQKRLNRSRMTRSNTRLHGPTWVSPKTASRFG